MRTRYLSLTIAGAVILITQAIPDLPATALAQVRVPIEPIPIKPVPVRVGPRGGGCGGGVPAAKIPVRTSVPKVEPLVPLKMEPIRPPVLNPEPLRMPPPIREGGANFRPEGVPTPGTTFLRTEPLPQASFPLAPSRDMPAVQSRLSELGAATKDEGLVRDVKEFLDVEELRYGRAEEAQKLLPAGREKEDPRVLLRDMKKRFEAKYPEGPGERVEPPKVGPVPQPEGDGVKALPKEKAGGGLPSLEEQANTAERVCRERLTAELRRHSNLPPASLNLLLDQLRRPAQDRKAREEGDAACEEEVSRLLGRQLEPSERVLVRVMRGQGKRPAEMADVLRPLGPAIAKP
jgi:hypothetical protein